MSPVQEVFLHYYIFLNNIEQNLFYLKKIKREINQSLVKNQAIKTFGFKRINKNEILFFCSKDVFDINLYLIIF